MPAVDPEGLAAKVNSSSARTDDIIWRLPTTVQFDRRTWDEETVVFNLASGQTHLLDALSVTVLAAFEDRPWTVAALAQSLASDFAVVPPEMLKRLNTIVGEFERLGLLESGIA